MRDLDGAADGIAIGCYLALILLIVGWWAFVIFMLIKTAQHFGIL